MVIWSLTCQCHWWRDAISLSATIFVSDLLGCGRFNSCQFFSVNILILHPPLGDQANSNDNCVWCDAVRRKGSNSPTAQRHPRVPPGSCVECQHLPDRQNIPVSERDVLCYQRHSGLYWRHCVKFTGMNRSSYLCKVQGIYRGCPATQSILQLNCTKV